MRRTSSPRGAYESRGGYESRVGFNYQTKDGPKSPSPGFSTQKSNGFSQSKRSVSPRLRDTSKTKREVSKEVKREINLSLVERMTQRQIVEAIQYAKQKTGSISQKVGYDSFYDVFYYLGTFTEEFSKHHYQELNIRERLFAETLWSLLSRSSGQDQNQFFSLDDTKLLQVMLSFYSPRSGTTKQAASMNLVEAVYQINTRV